MSIRVVRFAELAPEIVSTLEAQLAEYYRTPPETYYQIADQAAQHYTPSLQPFHCDLVGRVRAGMSLLEVGCGSAHLCPLVEAAGGSYTGMDYSDELLQTNRRHFPRARFLPIGGQLPEEFDIVASLYTIEHVADPPSYLKGLWDYCKPGGLIAIICPEFVDGDSVAPSVYYGRTPRRLRDKITSFDLGDAFQHLVDLLWVTPRWRSRARSAPAGAFWINLKPRILHGAQYSIDADAVHFPRLKDLEWWLSEHSATILDTSRTLPDIPDALLRYNCYIIARKPLR